MSSGRKRRITISRLASSLLLLATACGSTGGAPASAAAPAPAAASAGAPPSFLRSTADARVARLIDVRDGLTHAQAMRLLTDALAVRYTVDVTDSRAGFAMTAWQAPIRDGAPDLRYRTRISARFLGDDWKRLQVRDEANWARGDEWDVGYDAAQLDSVSVELKAKLGRKT